MDSGFATNHLAADCRWPSQGFERNALQAPDGRGALSTVNKGFAKHPVATLVATVAAYHTFLLVWNSDIFYNPIGYVDPYMYVGIGLYFDNHEFWDFDYKISRAPWVLMQYGFRQILTAAVAGPALQFVCFVLLAVSVYWCLRFLYRKEVAFSVALFSIFLPISHSSAGADYYNAILGPLEFLSLALMFATICRNSIWIAGLCGAALAAAIHTQPLLMLAAPLFLLPGVVLARQHKLPLGRLAVLAGAVLAGAIALTGVFSVVYASFGRSWLFFMPQVEFFLRYGSRNWEENPWWAPWSWPWLQICTANALMLAVLVASLTEMALIAASQSIRREITYFSVYAGYVLVYVIAVLYVIAVYLEFIKGMLILKHDYIVYVFYILTLLPIASMLDRGMRGGDVRLFWTYASVGLPLAFVALLVGRGYYEPGVPYFVSAFCAFAAFYGLLLLTRARGLSAAVILFFLPIVAYGAVRAPGLYHRNSCHVGRHLNSMMSAASQMGVQLVKRPDLIFVWFDRHRIVNSPNKCFDELRVDFLGTSFASIAHTYLGKKFALTELQALAKEDFQKVADEGGMAALLTVDGAESFQARAGELGFALTPRSLFHDRKTGVDIVFYSIASSEPAGKKHPST